MIKKNLVAVLILLLLINKCSLVMTDVAILFFSFLFKIFPNIFCWSYHEL